MDLLSRLEGLFGTEEYVGMRIQIVLLREMLLNHDSDQLRFICSGSFGEGVAYPESDDDLMLYRTDYLVVKTYTDTLGYLQMVPSECSPGYCLLLDITRSHHEDVTFIFNGMRYLSSLLWKQKWLTDGQFIHGPCQSGTFASIEFDFAICFSCSFWPDVAHDWVIRNRPYCWPSQEMIQDIVRHGCHVVPIGNPHSPLSQHEWRISFSLAERALVHSFNHAQFLTYNLLRLSLKRIIEKIIPGVLCSYFMKTTLFYSSENNSTLLWQVNDLERCIKTCLSVLYDFVDHIYCPNYFIPEYNMINGKVNHTNRHQLLDLIRLLHAVGIVGIVCLSGESLCLDDNLSLPVIEWKLDMDFMFSIHLNRLCMTIFSIFNTLPYETIESCTFSLCKFVRLLEGNRAVIQSKFINIILKRGIIYCCHQLMNRLFRTSNVNKQKYHYHKTIESLLRLGYNGDVTTGKLTRATYSYMMGKTELALFVIQKLLSEYPPYVMDGFPNVLARTTYIDVMCSRGYTMDHKARRAFATGFEIFTDFMNAFPLPLKIWISISEEFHLHPLSYAFFLESLCYVQLRNNISLIKSTRCLANRVKDVRTGTDIICTRMCVGIIKYVQGDSQSACRWLGSAYMMKDMMISPFNGKISRSVSMYISCMLNKHFRSVNRIYKM